MSEGQNSQTGEFRSGVITFVGRPNSGKSTLINALLGEQLCVATPLPQTTRKQLKGIYTDSHCQIVCIDTPGIHLGGHRFNESLVRESEAALKAAAPDCVVYTVDCLRPFGEEEDRIAVMVGLAALPVLMVFNKVDLVAASEKRREEFGARYPALASAPGLFTVGTAPETGVQLKEALLPFLPPGPALFDAETLTDRSLRFFAAEYLQKGVILATRDEVPHACFVEITDYRERERKHTVYATIHVETQGQKGILIGNRGSMIKRIRRVAERELSGLTGVNVSYTCHVCVTPGWRNNRRFLREMGFQTG